MGTAPPGIERALIDVTGLVQGVGFRPFVHTLATSLELRGFVQNRGSHVFVDLEGEAQALAAFVNRLTASPPPLATIDRLEWRRAAPASHRCFVIADSEPVSLADVQVAPDVATCEACLAELFDPGNRRYRHPFIACTNCGPRFSIVTRLPYDRGTTAMAPFPMCDDCQYEYADPSNRRFHAQTIACPTCGPTLVARHRTGVSDDGDASFARVAGILREGGIVAVKGLGGYHLACDATNAAAVAELRRRKNRDAKPFAVMIPDECGWQIGAHAGEALRSPERPIVLLDQREVRAVVAESLADNVAPGCPAVGLLLPYTPIHHVLLHDLGRPLVMTSGNRSDEPMVCDDALAFDELADIADLFLTHDRRIEVRCDDTVVRASRQGTSMVRRGRGHAPSPIRLAERTSAGVFAVGGHLKNTLCLATGNRAYLSSHIGDLEPSSSYLSVGKTAEHLIRLLGIEPETVAHDLHPDYLSTRFAMAYPVARRVAVQHHHAHVLSCVAEHGCTEPVIGVAFDGAGLGIDGAIWGGEFLIAEGATFRRAAHLAYVPLPGGDVAAREPWRMAVSHLTAAYGRDHAAVETLLASRLSPSHVHVAQQMIAGGFNAPPTSSMGRLFDAVASIIGLRDRSHFEGQAAMELEALGTGQPHRCYRFALDSTGPAWTIHAGPVIREIARDVTAGRSPADISAAFHEAVGTMVAEVAGRIAKETGIRRVALTGGVFQNALLSRYAAEALKAENLDVLQHRRVPCNDGGLSLGQALLAMRLHRAGAGSH